MEFSAVAIAAGIISSVMGIFAGVISAIICIIRFRERLIKLEWKIKEIENLKDTVESLKEKNLRIEGLLHFIFRLNISE